MVRHRHIAVVSALALAALLSGCGGFGGGGGQNQPVDASTSRFLGAQPGHSKLGDLFTNRANPNVTVKVNKYIWEAALDVLDFLPVQSIDPFSGVIVTGYGTPPGGGRSYRATIYVQDPALDARSLKLSLQSSGGGAVAPATVSAVEDAILNRARQLRIADAGM